MQENRWQSHKKKKKFLPSQAFYVPIFCGKMDDVTKDLKVHLASNYPHLKSSDRHFVQFYDNGSFLLGSLEKFIIDGLKAGDSAIVIATPVHVNQLKKGLKALGFDVNKLQGRIKIFDAEDTLSKFMIDEKPNKVLFDKIIGDLVKQSTGKGLRVRAFGEMVDILWNKGNESGAIELEKFWNKLVDKRPLYLFCAYKVKDIKVENYSYYNEVINTHTSSRLY